MLDPSTEAANAAKAAGEAGLSPALHYIFTLFMLFMSILALAGGWLLGVRKKDVLAGAAPDYKGAIREVEQEKDISEIKHDVRRVVETQERHGDKLENLDRGQKYLIALAEDRRNNQQQVDDLSRQITESRTKVSVKRHE